MVQLGLCSAAELKIAIIGLWFVRLIGLFMWCIPGRRKITTIVTVLRTYHVFMTVRVAAPALSQPKYLAARRSI
jgi:hypothetical protein